MDYSCYEKKIDNDFLEFCLSRDEMLLNSSRAKFPNLVNLDEATQIED